MMEVTIHWTSLAGDSFETMLVNVNSNGDRGRPNPFDATQANIAIDTALREFRAMPPFKSDGLEQHRRITSIQLRQTEDRWLTP